jgi:catechol 2,3-dioxygenase-like lactoylglutathione lyase family enzyme
MGAKRSKLRGSPSGRVRRPLVPKGGEPVTEPRVRGNETIVPVMPCVSAEETLRFYEALGFETTYKQVKPYLYLSLEWSGFALHFVAAPKGADAAKENGVTCLILVDAVAPYHAAFTEAMRETFGKVLASGLPRITRHRPGASRFTLVDPSGNSIIFVQRDEPRELEYGGSAKLEGLAKALDSARIYREFKNDDRAAFRVITSGLRRYGAQAAAVDRALALAALIELATDLDEHEKIEGLTEELRAVHLTEPELRRVEEALSTTTNLERRLGGSTEH